MTSFGKRLLLIFALSLAPRQLVSSPVGASDCVRLLDAGAKSLVSETPVIGRSAAATANVTPATGPLSSGPIEILGHQVNFAASDHREILSVAKGSAMGRNLTLETTKVGSIQNAAEIGQLIKDQTLSLLAKDFANEGGKFNILQTHAPELGTWTSQVLGVEFTVNAGKPEINLGAQTSMDKLAHELDHFVRWKRIRDKLVKQGKSGEVAGQLAWDSLSSSSTYRKTLEEWAKTRESKYSLKAAEKSSYPMAEALRVAVSPSTKNATNDAAATHAIDNVIHNFVRTSVESGKWKLMPTKEYDRLDFDTSPDSIRLSYEFEALIGENNLAKFTASERNAAFALFSARAAAMESNWRIVSRED